MAQAALQHRPPRFGALGPLLRRRSASQPRRHHGDRRHRRRGLGASGAAAGSSRAGTPTPFIPSPRERRARKPDRKSGGLPAREIPERGQHVGRAAVLEPRKHPVQGWRESHSGRDCEIPRHRQLTDLSPGPRLPVGGGGERALQCMPGDVVRRRRLPDSGVTRRRGRWFCERHRPRG